MSQPDTQLFDCTLSATFVWNGGRAERHTKDRNNCTMDIRCAKFEVVAMLKTLSSHAYILSAHAFLLY